ncbi:MAG: cobalamin-dependent protein [Spirochaetes bacterium]|nr:cobalamin-dependent protein [Spirochaetota bacterium]MBN2770952.1 cobalamin-dependent protein [Spirochaetota bacterium]
MRVMLVYVSPQTSCGKFKKRIVPSECMMLAAFLKNKHDVQVAFLSDLSLKSSVKHVKEINPDIVYFQIYSENRSGALKTIRELRKECRAYIAAGGPFITFLSAETAERYQEIDFLIRGEPELTLHDICGQLSRKKTPERIHHSNPMLKLNALPLVSESDIDTMNIDKNEQYKYLLTSRGSDHEPILSSYPAYAGRVIRFRSARKLVADIVNFKKKYGIIYFYIRDDNFLKDKDYVTTFCNELLRRKVYILWTCYTDVYSLDEKLLVLMKKAGLHRIRLDLVSGSQRILNLYAPGVKIDQIKKAADSIRKVGIYLSVRSFTGLPEEAEADMERTLAFLKRILPFKCNVVRAHYIPGTTLYDEAVMNGKLLPSIWFKSSNPLIFCNEDPVVEDWKHEISFGVEILRQQSWFNSKNFVTHRRVNGKDSWVTDFIEGDYYLNTNQTAQADRVFRRIITVHPENCWGYLRMGKVKFRSGHFESAFDYYRTVTDLVPEYYGGWLKAAQSLVADGRFKEAKKWIEEAYRRNRYDLRIHNVRDVLRHH